MRAQSAVRRFLARRRCQRRLRQEFDGWRSVLEKSGGGEDEERRGALGEAAKRIALFFSSQVDRERLVRPKASPLT